MSQRAILAVVVLTAMLIGGNFTALKFALDHTSPFLLAAMRTVVGGSFLLTFARLRGERFPTRLVDLANIFAVSFSITTVSSALLVFGVNRVPAGVASLLASTMPMFTAVLSLVLLSTPITRLAALGLGVRVCRHPGAGVAVAFGAAPRRSASCRCCCRRWPGRSAMCG